MQLNMKQSTTSCAVHFFFNLRWNYNYFYCPYSAIFNETQNLLLTMHWCQRRKPMDVTSSRGHLSYLEPFEANSLVKAPVLGRRTFFAVRLRAGCHGMAFPSSFLLNFPSLPSCHLPMLVSASTQSRSETNWGDKWAHNQSRETWKVLW